MKGISPSTYVEFSFPNCLYSSIFSIIGCSFFNFSNTSTSVEYPLFFFLIIGSFNFSNNIIPNCFGEFTLNSSPANLYISLVNLSISSFNLFPNSINSSLFAIIPLNCISARTSTKGISILLNKSS